MSEQIERQPDTSLQPIPERLEAKYTIIDTCIKAGVGHNTIADGLRIARSSVYHAQKRLDSRYDLTSKKRLKLAARAVDSTLAGEAVGAADTPKASVVLAAAQMVYDRYQPVQRVTEGGSGAPQAPVSITILFGSGGQARMAIEAGRTIELPANEAK
jgi:hypothetical protein